MQREAYCTSVNQNRSSTVSRMKSFSAKLENLSDEAQRFRRGQLPKCQNCHLTVSADSNNEHLSTAAGDNTRRTSVLMKPLTSQHNYRTVNSTVVLPNYFFFYKVDIILDSVHLKQSRTSQGFNREAPSPPHCHQEDIKQTHLLPGAILPALPQLCLSPPYTYTLLTTHKRTHQTHTCTRTHAQTQIPHYTHTHSRTE